MATKYTVVFTREEREWLEEFTRRGRNSAAKVIQARALLLCDAGENGQAWPVVKITEALSLSSGTVNNLKKRVVELGLDGIFERRQRSRPPREIVYGGDFEAHVVALACSGRRQVFSVGRSDSWQKKSLNWKFSPVPLI